MIFLKVFLVVQGHMTEPQKYSDASVRQWQVRKSREGGRRVMGYRKLHKPTDGKHRKGIGEKR